MVYVKNLKFYIPVGNLSPANLSKILLNLFSGCEDINGQS